MNYPTFFDQAPTVKLHDPLSSFLGSFEGGVIEYNYLDAVKLAGHSCPTVAGAYLMIVKALAVLYNEEIPERGAIRVSFPDSFDEGVTGVMASVATLLTGAAGDGGFKGIGEQFNRCNLLEFNAETSSAIVFQRMDTGVVVEANYAAHRVPLADEAGFLIGKLVQGEASEQEAERFQHLWQDRVRKILIDHVDDPDVIQIHPR